MNELRRTIGSTEELAGVVIDSAEFVDGGRGLLLLGHMYQTDGGALNKVFAYIGTNYDDVSSLDGEITDAEAGVVARTVHVRLSSRGRAYGIDPQHAYEVGIINKDTRDQRVYAAEAVRKAAAEQVLRLELAELARLKAKYEPQEGEASNG